MGSIYCERDGTDESALSDTVKRSALIFRRSIGGRRFLDESLDVRLLAPEHVGAILTTALPGILLYVVGFPLGLLLVLLRLKARGALKHSESTYDRRWVLRLGFLFAGYEDEHVYWESLVLFRKALLSGAAVFLAHVGRQCRWLWLFSSCLSVRFR